MGENRSWKQRWCSIDAASDPSQYVRLMDITRSGRDDDPSSYRFFGLLDARAGDRVLDVGCGLGGAVRAVAPRVGATGQVVGVDKSATMIAEARRRAEGLALPVKYRQGDAHHLPFDDDTFDACFSAATFTLIDRPEQALADMIRVSRPGGQILISATDFGSWIFDATDQELTRKIMRFVCDHETNGSIARRLRRLFVDSGLDDVHMILRGSGYTDYTYIHEVWLRPWLEDAQTAGVVTAAEAMAWLRDLEERDRAGVFLLAGLDFTVVGRKP
ncbi:MAG TPA: methyltransferase domain-containing protein [Chloroflexota bacterium]|nr:methyltransferase domain-containing protein [Chloroflexota bacterium]